VSWEKGDPKLDGIGNHSGWTRGRIMTGLKVEADRVQPCTAGLFLKDGFCSEAEADRVRPYADGLPFTKAFGTLLPWGVSMHLF